MHDQNADADLGFPCPASRRAFLRFTAGLTLGLLMSPTPLRAYSDEAGGRAPVPSGGHDLLTLMLTGDVMTGRGIDQVLPNPGDPRLHEPDVTSAAEYVALAETANGPIPKPVGFAYVWGDVLAELEHRRPDARIINLETAVTKIAQPAPKTVNYRMNPENFPVITAAGVNCCSLANNHALDWGADGLLETLETIERAGVKAAGAGRNLQEASAPAILLTAGNVRVLVFAFGSATSGIPSGWAADERTPGLNILPNFSPQTVRAIGDQVRAAKKPGDVVVLSIHWGANWGYEISDEEAAFAHGLVDEAGVDVIHGHSSHHAKAIEVYRGKPIFYGCGDFLDDYEGIGGYEEFRDDLVLMYLPAIQASDGTLARLTMVPFQIRNFRLHRASLADAAWLRDTLTREGERFGTRVQLEPDNALSLIWT